MSECTASGFAATGFNFKATWFNKTSQPSCFQFNKLIINNKTYS
jgi:hypothetical protein